MPASFNAYTPMIDDLDAAFFDAPTRPTYILWHGDAGMGSIDGRHVFWDEPSMLRTILRYYRLAAAAGLCTAPRARPARARGVPQPRLALIAFTAA